MEYLFPPTIRVIARGFIGSPYESAALRWIRIGGEQLAKERDARDERERESLKGFRVEPKDPNDPRADTNAWGEERFDVVPWILGKLFG